MISRKAIFEVFPDRSGGFRWHVKRGGRIVADSGESYKRRRGATRAITNLALAIAKADFRVDLLEQAPKEKKRK
jgi:uncharacterized protein YegP (UPF0339 family)